MTKQQLAKRRNWAKLRLSGITFDLAVFSENELTLVKQMQELQKQLLGFWDTESVTQFDLKCVRYDLFLNGKIFKKNVTRKEISWYTDEDAPHRYSWNLVPEGRFDLKGIQNDKI